MDKRLLKSIKSDKIKRRNFREKQKVKLRLDYSLNQSMIESESKLPSESAFCSAAPKSAHESVRSSIKSAMSSVLEDSIPAFSEKIEEDSFDNETEEQYFNRFSSDDSNCDSDNDESDSSIIQESIFETQLIKDLREWAIDTMIPYSHLDKLLKVLKPSNPELPLSSKTLLKKASTIPYTIRPFNPHNSLSDSKFVYFGLAYQLQRTVNVDYHSTNILYLEFNADGLPLYSSSSIEFWPLLGKVENQDNLYDPFVIAVYCGEGKPSSPDLYMKEFLEELQHLLEDGITIKDRHFTIVIKCFICDMPARAFLKCTKGHTGYYACERCTVKGYRRNHRTLYPLDEGERRTDTSFRNMINEQHHKSISPLIRITPNIDMIKSFILDFMHLCCLGVMKKLLTVHWTKTPATKLNRLNQLKLSQRLVNLSKQIPDDFQRTTRLLENLSKWKATEFRFFLLYSGAFILKDILSETIYQHFLLFSVSCIILCSKQFCMVFKKNAKIYLQRFIALSKELYGEESLVMNMHCLSHLTDDVSHFNCPLSDITAFPYENTLGKLKKYLRSGSKPLEQLCRRLSQEYYYKKTKVQRQLDIEIIKSKKYASKLIIKQIMYKNYLLTNKTANNVIMLKNGDIMTITEMFCFDEHDRANEIRLTGNKIIIDGPAFKCPCDSTPLKIFKIKAVNVKQDSITVSLNDVECKMVLLEIYELPDDVRDQYVLPFLH